MDSEDVIIKLKFFNRPGIIINGKGIVIGKCVVNWEEIGDYSVVKTKSKAFMLLFVDEPQHFINEGNWVTRWRMKMNLQKYKTPIRIPTSYLQCSLDELKEVILEGMKNHALSKRDK
jgi:hypothetical protein